MLKINAETLRKELWRMSNDGLLRKIGNRYAWPLEAAADEYSPWSETNP
jgi:hypothetical protein